MHPNLLITFHHCCILKTSMTLSLSFPNPLQAYNILLHSTTFLSAWTRLGTVSLLLLAVMKKPCCRWDWFWIHSAVNICSLKVNKASPSKDERLTEQALHKGNSKFSSGPRTFLMTTRLDDYCQEFDGVDINPVPHQNLQNCLPDSQAGSQCLYAWLAPGMYFCYRTWRLHSHLPHSLSC